MTTSPACGSAHEINAVPSLLSSCNGLSTSKERVICLYDQWTLAVIHSCVGASEYGDNFRHVGTTAAVLRVSGIESGRHGTHLGGCLTRSRPVTAEGGSEAREYVARAMLCICPLKLLPTKNKNINKKDPLVDFCGGRPNYRRQPYM
jgi:hypothetical protein